MGANEDGRSMIVVEAESCDVESASYDRSLSSAGKDAEDNLLYATWDKVAYNPSVQVVEKVLAAHGYALNLENVLACIDELKIGYRVQISSQENQHTKPIAQSFLPALSFRLPTKGRIGSLLGKFYAEVEGYQTEILRLRESQGQQQGAQRKELSRLERECERLQKENEQMKAQLAELNQEVAYLRRANFEAKRAIAAHNYLPTHVHAAQVQEVDLAGRSVALKSGRRVFSVPLIALWVLPRVKDHCLVSIQNSQITGVFFHENQQVPQAIVMAQVLHVEEGRCKIRDQSRRTRVLEAQNPAERSLIGALHRGDQLLLFVDSDVVVRFIPCEVPDSEAFVDAVQRSIILHSVLAEDENLVGQSDSELGTTFAVASIPGTDAELLSSITNEPLPVPELVEDDEVDTDGSDQSISSQDGMYEASDKLVSDSAKHEVAQAQVMEAQEQSS